MRGQHRCGFERVFSCLQSWRSSRRIQSAEAAVLYCSGRDGGLSCTLSLWTCGFCNLAERSSWNHLFSLPQCHLAPAHTFCSVSHLTPSFQSRCRKKWISFPQINPLCSQSRSDLTLFLQSAAQMSEQTRAAPTRRNVLCRDNGVRERPSAWSTIVKDALLHTSLLVITFIYN